MKTKKEILDFSRITITGDFNHEEMQKRFDEMLTEILRKREGLNYNSAFIRKYNLMKYNHHPGTKTF